MRWIGLMLLFLCNSGCIFVEGSIIEEPKDVVIPPCIYQYTAYSPCHAIDVTQAERTTHCKKKNP